MDIWAWVEKLYDELTEAGQERAASFLYSLPELVCDDEGGQAAALFPEALAAAKALKNPWMEVFFRHWQMRMRMDILGEGETALPEAVSLLEFSHRDECRDCPQSVCTVQDIAACYGMTDGPGWAEERIAVCRETIGRIDPTWNCYSCLHLEWAEALADKGEAEQAAALLHEAARDIKKKGKEVSLTFELALARHMQKAGKISEALKYCEALEGKEFPDDGPGTERMKNLLLASLLAETGRTDEALETLPEWGGLPPFHYSQWTTAMAAVAARRPELNNWSLGGRFFHALQYMSSVGAHRRVMETGERCVRLALGRNAGYFAERALAVMRGHLPKLRLPLGAAELLATLEQEAVALPAPVLPVPAAELTAYLQGKEDRDPEQEVPLLLAALQELPEDSGLALLCAEALNAVEDHDGARRLLEAFIRRFPDQGEAVMPALIALIPAKDEAVLLDLAELMDGHVPFLGHWCRAHAAYRREEYGAAAEHLAETAQILPKARGTRRFWAECAMRGKDFAQAVRVRQDLIAILREAEEEYRSDQWDLMVAASCAEDWKIVRSTAAAMGFPIEEGESELHDPGEWLRLVFTEDGRDVEYVAERTGPATATIVEVSVGDKTQKAGQRLVFEPSPLEPEPEDEEERSWFYTPYKAVHLRQSPRFAAWTVDGPAPSDEEWQELRDALREKGRLVWMHSSGGYTLEDAEARTDEEREVPGIFFSVAAPEDVSPAELDAELRTLTAGWKLPVSWLALAEAAGTDSARHRKIIERFSIEQ